MITFELTGGTEAGKRLMNNVRLWASRRASVVWKR